MEMEIELVRQPDTTITNVLCFTGGSVEFDEERLVTEARGGSMKAFQQLVECYGPKVLQVARRIAHTYEDAEDVMQDAFVQAYKNLSNFRGESKFSTWLVRITINAGLMQMRRRHLNEISIDVPAKEDLSPFEVEDWGFSPPSRLQSMRLAFRPKCCSRLRRRAYFGAESGRPSPCSTQRGSESA